MSLNKFTDLNPKPELSIYTAEHQVGQLGTLFDDTSEEPDGVRLYAEGGELLSDGRVLGGGPEGDKGLEGEKGADGEQGDKGATGISIAPLNSYSYLTTTNSSVVGNQDPTGFNVVVANGSDISYSAGVITISTVGVYALRTILLVSTRGDFKFGDSGTALIDQVPSVTFAAGAAAPRFEQIEYLLTVSSAPFSLTLRPTVGLQIQNGIWSVHRIK